MAPDRVSYYYDNDIVGFRYGEDKHPMKPLRVHQTHSLVMHYKLHKKLHILRALPATPHEMTRFHTDDYIEFLQQVTPEILQNNPDRCERHGVGADSPFFPEILKMSAISAGGSMEGACRLNNGNCDVAINWAGGLHHAKKDTASGFCYVNDVVLGILELLRIHDRVMYIDIDIHHGDGVEEAFLTTDRVMTVSFHQIGSFFPHTGLLQDTGIGKGKNHAVNVPLRRGISDDSYAWIFKHVIENAMKQFMPKAVVLQCGADSLARDRLGWFNLSSAGHASCVAFVQSFNLPLLVLGGGGYTPTNVSRCWTLETGTLLKTEMDPELPWDEDEKKRFPFYRNHDPDFLLHVPATNMEDLNTRQYLEGLLKTVVENLRDLNPCPSAPMNNIPVGLGTSEEMEGFLDDEDEDLNKDVRDTTRRSDKRVEHPNEFMDSDEEDRAARISMRSHFSIM